MIKQRQSLHLAFFRKVFPHLRTAHYEIDIKWSYQFLNLRKMIIIFTPVLSLSRLKQEISSEHLVDHAGK